MLPKKKRAHCEVLDFKTILCVGSAKLLTHPLHPCGSVSDTARDRWKAFLPIPHSLARTLRIPASSLALDFSGGNHGRLEARWSGAKAANSVPVTVRVAAAPQNCSAVSPQVVVGAARPLVVGSGIYTPDPGEGSVDRLAAARDPSIPILGMELSANLLEQPAASPSNWPRPKWHRGGRSWVPRWDSSVR